MTDKINYQKARAKGKCGVCTGRLADKGFATCSICRESIRLQEAKRRTYRIEHKLCSHCGKTPIVKWGQCETCYAKHLKRRTAEYRQYVTPCVVCGFVYSDVHHINGKTAGDGIENLVSLCPNHHRLLHLGLLKL